MAPFLALLERRVVFSKAEGYLRMTDRSQRRNVAQARWLSNTLPSQSRTLRLAAALEDSLKSLYFRTMRSSAAICSLPLPAREMPRVT